jgi:probable DNA repair protein
MPSLPEPLRHALATGATVVTPNRRLARRIVALYDQGQRRAGRLAWPAPRVLPWGAWLPALWQDVVAAGAASYELRLQSPVQAAHAWRRIVATHAAPLVDPEGAAVLAADAWETVHAWGEGGAAWRRWEGDALVDEDCAAFARWASRYARDLAADGAVDPAELGDRLCACLPRWLSAREVNVALAGFTELSPQQQRLQVALTAAGAQMTRVETLPAEQGRVVRASGTTPDDEIARALAWARERALADADATIAIAIADLAARRDAVRARAEEILCPALQWPGAESAQRPYNVSLGGTLGDVPLVAAALEMVAWADGPLPVGRAAAVLRSPYLGTPEAWLARAALERAWLEQGRRTLTLRAAQAGLRAVDRDLALRWEEALERDVPPARGSPREHAEAWRTWLGALTWPGTRPLDSAEHQARAALDEALAEFATLGVVEARMSRADALAALRAQLGRQVFQPEAAAAPIQIVGLLEAAGQPFDALWVAGLAAERWPPAPHPHPFLPVAWQRQRNVPRSTAVRELAYATELTREFARAATEVVFSHPATIDDHESSASPLIPEASAGTLEPPPEGTVSLTQLVGTASCERLADEFAPPLALPERARGGARLIEAQSACPFKAMATHRLAAEAWPEPIDGLSAQERGILVHAALAAFWAATGTQRAFAAMTPDALRASIAAAAELARTALPAARWRTVLPAVAAEEGARIEGLVADWLFAHERTRPPFAVIGIEKGLALDVHGLTISLRLDRVDALDGGGVAIVDYKTGRTSSPDVWFEPRPRAPQLGLYALAQRAATPGERVRAVAYAQLKAGELAVRGLAADDSAWPGLPLPSKLRRAAMADWNAALAHWAGALDALGTEIVAGLATVTPRDPRLTCKHCGLQPFCRIGAVALRAGERDDSDDDDDD